MVVPLAHPSQRWQDRRLGESIASMLRRDHLVKASRQDQTMKSLLFIGAGASKPFGVPLTREIMSLIRKRLKSSDLFCGSTKRFPSAKKQMRLLEELMERFLPGIANIDPDDVAAHPLITDVLSLTDHLINEKVALGADFSGGELESFRALMEHAVISTLEPDGDLASKRRREELLRRLVDWILMPGAKESTSQPRTIISTNYDIILEQEIFTRMPKNGKQVWSDRDPLYELVDFGFSHRTIFKGTVVHRPKSPLVSIFKLHGSLNWLKCPACGFIYINKYGTIYDLAFIESRTTDASCHCGFWPLQPVIVAPSMVRSVQNPNLLATWQAALKALRTADQWIIIGYSLPPEDLAIRSILMRAYNGRGKKPTVRVIQHASAPETKARYELLFPGCHYKVGGLEAFIDGLKLGRPAEESLS